MPKNHTNNAEEVAHYFLKLAGETNQPVTNKVLQKLVYYAQVWYYTIFEEKLFTDKIEAWVHGPAVRRLYGKFKAYQFGPIQIDASGYRFNFSPKQKAFLKNIWDLYGKLDASYLEALTHAELPWQEARQGLLPGQASSKEISLKTAREFYGAKLNTARSRSS